MNGSNTVRLIVVVFGKSQKWFFRKNEEFFYLSVITKRSQEAYPDEKTERKQCGQLGLQNANWATRKSVWLLKKQCWLLPKNWATFYQAPKNWATFYQAPKNWATFHRALQFEKMSDACEGCRNKIHIFDICQN